ncbi:hypothetical protein EON82_21620 [bacterium]|nr:MAG: hypothetical protein EON82_21620 [bacterium]
MNDAEYPRPPTPDNQFEDKPFALRQPPQELIAGLLMLLTVAAVHYSWESLPIGRRLALAPYVLPLQTGLPSLFCFWVYRRAHRTGRPKTARLMLGTAIVLVIFSLAGFAFATYTAARVERALGPGWERRN